MIRTEFQNETNKDKKLIIKEKLRNISEEIEGKWFSSEYVFRELYLLGYYNFNMMPYYRSLGQK